MRHFGHIAPEVRQRLFHREPCEFTADSPARLLCRGAGRHALQPGHPAAARRRHPQAGRARRGLDGAVPGGLHRRRGRRGGRGEPGPAVRRPRATATARGACRCSSSGSAPPSRSPTSCAASAPPSGCCPDSCCPSSPRSAASPSWRRSPRAEAASGRRLFAMPVLESPELLHLESRVGDPRRASPAPSTSTASGSSRCASASPTSAPPTGCAAPPT